MASVCLYVLVTSMNPAKMAEPIEMPFVVDSGGPRNHALGRSLGPPGDDALLGVIPGMPRLAHS